MAHANQRKSVRECCAPKERGTINYGTMRQKLKKSHKLDLPFFSNISPRPAVQRWQLLGYKVELHPIEKR